MNKIICGKFDNYINFNFQSLTKKRIRIGSVNPNKLKTKNYIPIATNGKFILYRDNLYEVRSFFISLEKSLLKNLMVLTIKERELILKVLVDFSIDISVFEVKYPIFEHIRFISNIYKNYTELEKLLNKVSELHIPSKSLAKYLSTTYLYQIERKLRFKTQFDKFFAFAYKGGYQEVFKLKEEREDRVIIALDFNSMYVDCMMNDFMEPKSIKYIDYRDKKVNINSLENGLYRVVLKNPTNSFFKNYHPFKYTYLNKSFTFGLEEEHEIEILLFKNEIEYYQKFFSDFEIVEGFFTPTNIQHPLREYGEKIYEERLKYKLENNKVMSSLCKYKLLTIHSATNAKRFKVLFFENLTLIIKYLTENYMFDFPKNLNDIEKLVSIEDKNYFQFWKYKDGYKVKVVNFDTNESIYSISSQITANGRLKMMQTIETFLSHHSVELCYANIDSLHISILENEVEAFLEKNKNIISDKLGDLKIESISKRGYWFDIGRYWLKNRSNVSLFKNTIFNSKWEKKLFVRSKKIRFIHKNNYFNFVKEKWLNIYNTFSYNKRLEQCSSDKCLSFRRYNYEEIKNLEVVNKTINSEILESKKTKINLLRKITTV